MAAAEACAESEYFLLQNLEKEVVAELQTPWAVSVKKWRCGLFRGRMESVPICSKMLSFFICFFLYLFISFMSFFIYIFIFVLSSVLGIKVFYSLFLFCVFIYQSNLFLLSVFIFFYFSLIFLSFFVFVLFCLV